MDRSWSLLEQSFKETDETTTIDSCTSGEEDDYEFPPVKRPKSNFSTPYSSHKNVTKQISFQNSNVLRAYNSNPVPNTSSSCQLFSNDDINDVSSDDLFDDKDISPSSSPAHSQFAQTLCTIASTTAFATNTPPKVIKKKFVKNGLAIKCQALMNQQKSAMFLLSYPDAEDNSIELTINKKSEEYGKCFIQSDHNIVILKPEQAKQYSTGDRLKITNSTEFISIKPSDSVLNVYLNVCHIDSIDNKDEKQFSLKTK